jgi:hypothetical protein
MELILIVKDWEHTPQVSLEELVRRLASHFPRTIVDREKGDANVQERLEKLIEMEAPRVILDSHRSYFGNTIFVSIAESAWNGAAATSYLTLIRPPLGDAVYFDVVGADSTSLALIKRELEVALDMVHRPDPRNAIGA